MPKIIKIELRFDKVVAKIKWCSFFDSHGRFLSFLRLRLAAVLQYLSIPHLRDAELLSQHLQTVHSMSLTDAVSGYNSDGL